MKRFVICLICILMLLPGFAVAGEGEEKPTQPSPEEIQKQMDTAFSAVAPMMGKMMEAMIEAQLTVLAKPESADKIARYVKNLQDALMKQGFTRDEALKIATSIPLPSASLSSK